MTEKLLRDVIKEAKEKKQLGIVIWSSWTTWENMGQGNKEVEENTVAVRSRGNVENETINADEFVAKIKEEVENKSK